jgi:hypothetical protein
MKRGGRLGLAISIEQSTVPLRLPRPLRLQYRRVRSIFVPSLWFLSLRLRYRRVHSKSARSSRFLLSRLRYRRVRSVFTISAEFSWFLLSLPAIQKGSTIYSDPKHDIFVQRSTRRLKVRSFLIQRSHHLFGLYDPIVMFLFPSCILLLWPLWNLKLERYWLT